ncbi:MAG: PD-(D/E)XK nuclease family protein [Candidatus Binatia bacterium]
MSRSARDEALLRHLDSEPPAWILTVTQRLAFTLRARAAEIRSEAGRAVADTPPIHSLDEWLEMRGREILAREVAAGAGTPGAGVGTGAGTGATAGAGARTGAAAATAGGSARGRVLLTAAAEQLAWERIIVKYPGDQPGQLLDTAALAATAADAWKRICLWGEPSWSGPLAEDAEAFLNWLPHFRARLDAEGFVTRAELAGLVTAAIGRGDLDGELPASVVLLGFEKHDPAATRVIAALRERGINVSEELVQEPADEIAEELKEELNEGLSEGLSEGLNEEIAAAAAVRAWAAPTPAIEVRSVAARIRELLLATPDLRVGVLTPDLSAYGSRLERVFEEELDPAGVLDPDGTSVRRFDYAEAPALACYPLVAAALDLLALAGLRIPFHTASRILLCDYPRDADARIAERTRIRKGVVEARLRRERSAVLHLAGRPGSLATVLRKENDDKLAGIAHGFEKLAERLVAAAGTRRSPSGWRKEWVERLTLAGWPGHIAGDVEGLVFRRWRDALDEFALLEMVEPSMREDEALSRLRAVCLAQRVQPPASSRSVQVMNLLDAAGLEFDVVFAIGMTATAFPAPPRPNPLLPVAWQRAQPGMTRASVEGERALAESVWSRLRRSTREVLASYPLVGERDEECSPSPFVAAAEEDTTAPVHGPWWLASASAAERGEERPVDTPGPARVRRGSSTILQYQSDCAFRAFASKRLAAEKLDAIQPQPDAARRGTLVHKALEKAYLDIPSYEDLQGLGAQNIAEVARAAADHAIENNADFFADAADLAAAARLWLAEMVEAWMIYEQEARQTPWQVEGVEQGAEFAFPPSAAEPLTISIRPDRVDRVSEDAVVILDFKTSGTAKGPSRWNGERPEELQLPLYLALLDKPGSRVDGIAFANLSARDACELKGVAAGELAKSFKPPPKQDYIDAVASWRATLETLALAYLAGDVRVDPRNARVCQQCSGHAFCRVTESGLPEADDAAEDAE